VCQDPQREAVRGEHLDVALRSRPPLMVSMAEAEWTRMRSERLSESRIRAAEARKRCSEAAAAAGAAKCGSRVD
jgi:hypothetical protein